jgi:curved DNA-binding protein CbpA
MAHPNFYELLGVSAIADRSEIKRAFRSLAQKCHPDKNLREKEWANGMMKRLNEAWLTLSNPELKKVYDAKLKSEEDLKQAHRDSAYHEAEQARRKNESEDRAKRDEARVREMRAKQAEQDLAESLKRKHAEAAARSQRHKAKRMAEKEEHLRRKKIEEEWENRFKDQGSDAFPTQSAPLPAALSTNRVTWTICALVASGLLAAQFTQVNKPAETTTTQIQAVTGTSRYPRCAGNPELAKCEEFERQRKEESGAEKLARIGSLEEGRAQSTAEAAKQALVANRSQPLQKNTHSAKLKPRQISVPTAYDPPGGTSTTQMTPNAVVKVEPPVFDQGRHPGYPPECRWLSTYEWSCKK